METLIDYEMSNADYHDKSQHPHISSSDVKCVATESAVHWLGKERKESSAFAIGEAVHSLILEPHKDLVLEGPEDRRGKKWTDAKAKADEQGKTLLTAREYLDALRMAEAALRFSPILRDIVNAPNFVAEASIFTHDEEFDMPVKCRPDGMLMPKAKGDKAVLIDIKTTIDASPSGFNRQIQKFRYDMQQVHYMRCLEWAGIPTESFYFVAVEKTAPFVTSVTELSELYAAYAEKAWKAAMSEIKEIQKQDEIALPWPDINQAHLPSWLHDEVQDNPF